MWFELTPYERRQEYYSNLQLGKDVQAQNELLKKATKAREEQLSRVAEVELISQERLNEQAERNGVELSEINEGIRGLRAAFEWGISEVVWRIEQNTEVLRSILAVLSAPLDTQGRELRKRAENAYANGWIDDALADFLASEEKNRYDFAIHINLGLIYLFQKVDREKALEYFEKAIKYARPQSSYYTSYALLYKALILRDTHQFKEAEACAAEAAELSPEMTEAAYQCAQYRALLEMPEAAMPMLKRAILGDVNYCEKALNDEVFAGMRTHLNMLFEELRTEERAKSTELFRRAMERMTRIDKIFVEMRQAVALDCGDLLGVAQRTAELIRRNSYRDFLEATRLATTLAVGIEEVKIGACRKVQAMMMSKQSEGASIANRCDQEINRAGDKLKWIVPATTLVCGVIGFKACWDLGGPGAHYYNSTDMWNGMKQGVGRLIFLPFFGGLAAWVLHAGIKMFQATSRRGEKAFHLERVEADLSLLRQYLSLLQQA